MALTTQQIYNAISDVIIAPKPPRAFDVCTRLLIESLAPQRKRVYEYVFDHNAQGVTSVQVARHLKITVASASNALKELYDFDLLVRSEEHDETGLFYVYRVGYKDGDTNAR